MSLHQRAQVVFAVPYVYKLYWNHLVPLFEGGPAIGTIGAGVDFRLDEVFFDGEAAMNILTDPLCGPGTPTTQNYKGELIASIPGYGVGIGWWADFNVFANQPATFTVVHGIPGNQTDAAGFAGWAGTIPLEMDVDTLAVPASLWAHIGHGWTSGDVVAWRLRNDGALAMNWAVEVKIKAGT